MLLLIIKSDLFHLPFFTSGCSIHRIDKVTYQESSAERDTTREILSKNLSYWISVSLSASASSCSSNRSMHVLIRSSEIELISGNVCWPPVVFSWPDRDRLMRVVHQRTILLLSSSSSSVNQPWCKSNLVFIRRSLARAPLSSSKRKKTFQHVP